MYLYSLYGYEENTVLFHEKEFTKKEFEKMCKQAPMFEFGNRKDYDSTAIKDYLVNEYGFLPVEYSAGFFVDGDAK